MDSTYYNLENMPIEMVDKILSGLTNPYDILNMSVSSNYVKSILTNSIDTLKSEDELLYLDIGWLDSYPKLKDVSDNIIFHIETTNLMNFIIPTNLMKFNIRILVKSDYDLSSYDENTFIKYIYQQLTNDITEYTVRIIINFESDSSLDHAVILDRLKFIYLNNFTAPNNLFNSIGINIDIDYKKLFNDVFGIKLLNLTIPVDIEYYEDPEHKDEILIEYVQPSKISIQKLVYPNKQFKLFMNEIEPRIRANIKMFSDEQELDLINTFKYYNKIGYINIDMMKKVAESYIDIDGFSNYEDLSETSKSIFQNTKNKLRLYMNLYKTFIYPDNNIKISHFYIDGLYFDTLYQV